MKIFKYYMVCFLALTSCNDPSLDQDREQDELVEPVFDLMQLSSIEIAQNTMGNVVETIDFQYDENNLISRINVAGTASASYEIEYAGNNKVERVIQDDGSITIYDFTYSNDFVFIGFTDPFNTEIVQQFYTDLQNRINRVVSVSTDVNGSSVQTSDIRYLYNANFNVERINSVAANSSNLQGYSELTYEFNNNPFRDMNDLLRLFIFPEFVPYTRYLPKSRIDYVAVTNGFSTEATFDYQYMLQDNDFPSSRSIIKTEMGSTTTTFEIYTYR